MSQRIGRFIPTIAKDILGKKGVLLGRLYQDWPEIMGEEMAQQCWPDKITFRPGEKMGGVLLLRVSGAAALEIQHSHNQLVERINSWAGYGMIAQIKLIQAPLPLRRAAVPKALPLPAAAALQLKEQVRDVANPELASALEALGKAILTKPEPQG